jgi:hypothetical protein
MNPSSSTFGKLKRLTATTGAIAETITITFTTPTSFDVSGSISGANFASGTTGVLFNNKLRFIAVGPFVAGNTLTVEVVAQGFINNGNSRSIQVQPGGRLILQGKPPSITRTKISSSITQGDSSFQLTDSVNWNRQDQIVVGSTDFHGTSQGTSEKIWSSTGIYSELVNVRGNIENSKFGLLQYITDSGVSTTASVLTSPPSGAATSIDQRAFVINLTRNIVIQGTNDTHWINDGFGAHVMVMGLTSQVKVNGVEFRQVGQAGAIGRYPFHWHILSYNMPDGMALPSDGAFIGDANPLNQYIKNCSIHNSSQRAIVIHGTCGVNASNNVCYDITGHAIFLEEGSEERNIITDNVIMKVSAPSPANKLTNTDINSGSLGSLGLTGGPNGSSGIWYSNPNNTLTGNWISSCVGTGIWNSFAKRCFNLTQEAQVIPISTPILTWSDNWSIGNQGVGAMTNDEVITNAGLTNQSGYLSPFSNSPITNLRSFKNGFGGYNNRITEGRYQGFICADNAGMDIFGQASASNGVTSVANNILTVAESLNNTNSRKNSSYRAAFATYHELLNFTNCLCVGYNYIEGAQSNSQNLFVGGGLFRMDDLYLSGIFSFSANTGNKLVDCGLPFRTRPGMIDGATINQRSWTLAGAIYDKTGIFGNQGKYWVYNDPFFTYSATSLTDATTGVPSNGKLTTDRYYGIGTFRHSSDLGQVGTGFMSAITFTRQDTNGNTVGTWAIPDGVSPWLNNKPLSIMRYTSFHKGGRYVISCPSTPADIPSGQIAVDALPPGNYFELVTQYMNDPDDIFLVAVPFANANTPVVYQGAIGAARDGTGRYLAGTSAHGRYLTSTGLFSNVVNDTTGSLFWQDTTNNLVWMQIKPSVVIASANASNAWGSDQFNLEYKKCITFVTV